MCGIVDSCSPWLKSRMGGGRAVISFSELGPLGEGDLSWDIDNIASVEKGVYSEQELSERGRTSATDIKESGESDLFSKCKAGYTMSPHSMSDAIDSEDIDLEVGIDRTGSNIFVAKSGVGESGNRSLYSFTEVTDSGDGNLTSYSSDGMGAASLLISESTDSGDGDLFSAVEAVF